MHTACTGVANTSAAVPFCAPCCAPALCVSTICNHVVPDLCFPGPGKGKPSRRSPFSVLSVCVDGLCCFPAHREGVASAQIPLEQTKRTHTCMPALELCTCTCVRPTDPSLASAIHGNCMTIQTLSRADAHPVQRIATLSGKTFQCLQSIKTRRSLEHWLYSANPSVGL